MLPPSKLLLNCREVVDEVFSYVDSDDRPDAQSLRKQTLVNSALAGRELHEPAMDARWSHLEDLRPLIALVRINGICNDAMATAFLELQKKADASYTERFRHHASRIRHVNALNAGLLSSAAWLVLSNDNLGKSLLPRLRSAGVLVDKTFGASIKLLVPRLLCELRLLAPHTKYMPWTQEFTCMLADSEKLSAKGSAVTDKMVDHIREASPRLMSLVVDTGGELACLCKLSGFVYLEKICISTFLPLLPSRAIQYFPSLRELQVQMFGVLALRDMMKPIIYPRLHTIRLHVSDRNRTTDDWFDIVYSIVKSALGDQLRAFDISAETCIVFSDTAPPALLQILDILIPLMTVPTLEELPPRLAAPTDAESLRVGPNVFAASGARFQAPTCPTLAGLISAINGRGCGPQRLALQAVVITRVPDCHYSRSDKIPTHLELDLAITDVALSVAKLEDVLGHFFVSACKEHGGALVRGGERPV
ncbi:hypothetical protein FOMPIDRAFT_82691 [Fomitopsis schrenkii]|uniref:Uncharacterized protein n=1 Tax=Fomitopsis schrenkii TaxID=2126942 RepID=S8FMI3_FOMSC|nr:hypothetical protein FOMPIDRAFT_82691 [Fomitopsis schrenkii]